MEPFYCPRCGNQKNETTSDGLCELCGERLARQSFCPVCERFWCEPPGTPCPKHEIPLEEFSEAEPAELMALASEGWETIARFDSVGLVHATRLRLEASGIPTFLDGERMGTISIYNIATGGIRLQVPRPLADEARRLLEQAHEPSNDFAELDEDLDDAFDELAPEPGARRRATMRVLILLILVFPPLWALFETFLLGLLRR